MKKALLAAAFFALASVNSFAAIGGSCTTGSPTLGTLNANYFNPLTPCTVTTTNGTWTLSTWGFGGSGSASQSGYPGGLPQGSDIAVTFAEVFGPGTNGFSVKFSDVPNVGNNFFSAAPQPGTNQTASWKSIFVIENGPVISNITNTLINGQTAGTLPDQGTILIQKIITNAGATGNPQLGDNNLSMGGNQGPGTFTGNVTGVGFSPSNTTVTRLGVIDNYQLNGGNANSFASLDGYTNSFYTVVPNNGIPEPMTFVLMGAGLVGVAFLRRRNG
jgi:hypothetical protein